MSGRLKQWLVVALFLGTAVYALAEDITLTTYYPSPRGVYQELRTSGDVKIGDISATPPGARLRVVQEDAAPALRVDDELNDLSPFVIDATGNVGIGTMSVGAKLEVNGDVLSKGNSTALMVLRTDGNGPGDNLVIGQFAGHSFIQFPVEGVNGVPVGQGGLTFVKRGENASISTPTLFLHNSGNVGIGTTVPETPAPNNQPGNLDANDVFLRSAGGGTWMSTIAIDFGGIYTFDSPGNCVHPNPYTGACSCPPGFTAYQFANGVAGREQFFWFCGR